MKSAKAVGGGVRSARAAKAKHGKEGNFIAEARRGVTQLSKANA
ncbi:unnamed protein product [marine sediment metagenome]|uniref:Uncharacterized protein n=1 Tax=marine sediment metagenome TaxID=412755 RepID=X0Y0W5_9ZZZZ